MCATKPPSVRGSRGTRGGRDSSSLPTIGRNPKSIAVHVPIKVPLVEGSQGNPINHRPNVVHRIPTDFSAALGQSEVDYDAAQWPQRPISGRSLHPLQSSPGDPPRSAQGHPRLGDDDETSIPSSRPQTPPSPQPPNTSTYRLNSRNQSRARSMHSRTRAPQNSKHRYSGQTGPLVVDNGTSTRRGGTAGRRGRALPALQPRSKEFICVTSQYTDPPAAALDGIIGWGAGR